MQVKSKKKLKVFDLIALLLNCFFSLALLLSYLAPYADPKSFWVIAIIGVVYPFLLLANIIFIIYWLFRVRHYSLISVICILIGFNTATKYFGIRISNSTNQNCLPGNLRIMAYNVHNFIGLGTLHHTYIQNQIFQLVNDEQPDIISMQEFSVNIANNKAIYSAAKKIMKSDQYYFKSYEDSPWDSVGVAIFSRFPIVNHGIVLTPQDKYNDMQAIFVDIKCRNKIFRVYSLHLQPIHLSNQDHQYISKIRYKAIVNPHETKVIYAKLKVAFIKRSYQVETIKKNMDLCPYPYLITGDFNDTPISFAVNQISKGLKNAFIEKGSGLGTTYYGDFPHFQIDYILASPQFDVINYQTIRKKISDHYAIVSDIKLN